MRVMILDDDPLVTGVVSVLLGQEGMEVLLPVDAADALTMMGQQRPDILLLDMHMPGVDGLSVLGALKRSLPDLQTRIVMLTAERDSHYITEARALGACGYITKPIDRDRLVAVVRRVHTQANLAWIDDYCALVRAEEQAA